MKHAIPDMTDPLGRHWQQPSRELILVDEHHALMSSRTLLQLPEYSSTLPSGTYTGKMWRRAAGNGDWWLCWYGDLVGPDQISIHRRPVLLA